MLKHGILGMLNYGAMTGYEIMTAFRDSLSHFWTAQTSQIYRELQVLEKEGWITAKPVVQKGKPDKKIMSITERGREELIQWLKDEQPVNVRMPLLMKTFFRGECNKEDNIAFFRSIAENPSVFPNGSEAARSAAERYGARIDDPHKSLYWKFTIEFGLMYEDMVRRWCEKCICEIENAGVDHAAIDC